jgi:hypothetical protein
MVRPVFGFFWAFPVNEKGQRRCRWQGETLVIVPFIREIRSGGKVAGAFSGQSWDRPLIRGGVLGNRGKWEGPGPVIRPEPAEYESNLWEMG